ncbi:WD40 repeat domain-containing protein [Candidatus Poribacteria bacterium]|nr:WD40 repeat domain-containing protein [Candidatus Poribacteria bacterium]
MKMMKLASSALLLTVAVFLTNGFAGDLPVNAIARIDVGEGPINALAYSRSANQIAVAAANSIHIYDANTYKELIVLVGHTDLVSTVAFSPNGKRLVSGSLDETMRLWNTSTGKLIRTREEHTAPVDSVAFSANGKRFWSASRENNTIRSWYVGDGGRWSSQSSPREVDLITIVCSYRGRVRARVLSSVPQQCLVEVPRLGTWRITTGHEDLVNVLTLYPDGKTLATGSIDRTIEVWNNADTDKPLYTLIGHTDGVTAIDFSVDAKRLASGSSDKTVRLWDLATGQAVQILIGHTSEIGAVTFLEDKALAEIALAKGKAVASGSSDGTVIIWDIGKIVSAD